MNKLKEIEKEIILLEQLQENWVKNIPNYSDAVDVYSDVKNFRNTTHEKFRYANRIYFNGNEAGDVYFGDAEGEIETYLREKKDKHFLRAMTHINDGFNYLIGKLKKEMNRI